ncbi:hypothetical protein SEVIR_8G202300v4 [Setaria viridis]|uniref:Uncharacterized protein n=1 Tax=Setaria viridis TaxID=4556 RepID=A0A4V6D396_SETVI|nr:hypothetical protein SEVIR_8G202300v2 [Setaria viridis]
MATARPRQGLWSRRCVGTQARGLPWCGTTAAAQGIGDPCSRWPAARRRWQRPIDYATLPRRKEQGEVSGSLQRDSGERHGDDFEQQLLGRQRRRLPFHGRPPLLFLPSPLFPFLPRTLSFLSHALAAAARRGWRGVGNMVIV